MMNHDPFQSYQTGAYPGGITPFGSPYAQYTNPALFGFGGLQNPVLQNPMLQNAMAQNPLLQNPILQNPILQNPLLQNPLLQHALHQHLQQLAWQNPLLTQAHGWPQQQQQQFGYPQQQFGYPQQQFGYPQQQQFGYPQQQLGYPLAPQGLIGGGIGQPFGQLHPLAQLALRQATGYGISPYGGGI